MPKKVQKRKRSGIFIYCTETEKARLKRMAMKTKRGTLSGYCDAGRAGTPSQGMKPVWFDDFNASFAL